MQPLKFICCQWKLKEFKFKSSSPGSADPYAAVYSLLLRYVSCDFLCRVFTMFIPCSGDALPHCWHITVTRVWLGMAVQSPEMIFFMYVWPDSTFYAESISTPYFYVLCSSYVWSYSPIRSFAEFLSLEERTVFVCCSCRCPLSPSAGAIIRTDTGTETIIPID